MDTRGRVVPPLLREQETLVDEVEGGLPPVLRVEASVLGEGLDASRNTRIDRRA